VGNRRRVDEGRKISPAVLGKASPAVLGGAVAVVVGVVGIGVYALNDSGAAADSRPHAPTAAEIKARNSRPLTAAEVQTTARRFLTSWQQGSVPAAAAATNNTAAATELLTGYTKDAHITGVTLTPGTPTGTKVPFSVKGKVSYDGVTKPVAYGSSLTVVRRPTDGKALVDWHSAVVQPDLNDGDTLVTGESGTPPVTALDRNGGVLTTAKYPSLGAVLDGLRQKYGKLAGGKAGVELRVARGKASQKAQLSDKSLVELSQGTPGTVKTTLDPTMEAAAEAKVAKKPKASVVVVRPSTGEILAVANSGHGFNTAFLGSLAPGSTMKIVTSTMLFEKKLITPDASHRAPRPTSWRAGRSTTTPTRRSRRAPSRRASGPPATTPSSTSRRSCPTTT
jgi:hypothetical protein